MINKTKWIISPQNKEVAFKVRHALIGYIKGAFGIFDADFYTTDDEIGLVKMNLTIDSRSINTGEKSRDEYLKSGDFLDVMQYPQIKFTSTEINKPDQEGNCAIWGELTMKGITKLIKLNVQFGKLEVDLWGNRKVSLAIKGSIYRSDWGLYWNQTVEPFGFMVGEEITISCGFELRDLVRRDVYKLLGPTVNEQSSLSRGNAA